MIDYDNEGSGGETVSSRTFNHDSGFSALRGELLRVPEIVSMFVGIESRLSKLEAKIEEGFYRIDSKLEGV